MDQTCGAVHVRRHNSLPSSRSVLHSSSPRRRLVVGKNPFQKNPYVGWFRHSPDTSSSSFSSSSWTAKQRLPCYSTRTPLPRKEQWRKASPYVGWFRHAPPTSMTRGGSSSTRPMIAPWDLAPLKVVESYKFNKKIQQEVLMLLQSLPRKNKNGVYLLADLLNGRLRGGKPMDTYSGENRPQESSSGTVQSLTRLAYWLLVPLFQENEDDVENDHSTLYSLKTLDNESLATAGSVCSEEDDENDDYDYDPSRTAAHRGLTTRSTTLSSSSAALDVGISSQAEAYYAHQAAKELNPEEESRLDYVITQMDIVRMQRNASRHLDVDSIYQLPTTTYRKTSNKPAAKKKPAAQETQEKEGWSWLLVRKDREPTISEDEDKLDAEAEQAEQEEEQGRDVCVICLEHFVDGDRLRVLPCSHSFHVGCIDRWLSGSCSFDDCHTAGCPTCKKRPDQNHGGDYCVDPSSSSSDGSVPSWAFTQLGSALARDSSSSLQC